MNLRNPFHQRAKVSQMGLTQKNRRRIKAKGPTATTQVEPLSEGMLEHARPENAYSVSDTVNSRKLTERLARERSLVWRPVVKNRPRYRFANTGDLRPPEARPVMTRKSFYLLGVSRTGRQSTADLVDHGKWAVLCLNY